MSVYGMAGSHHDEQDSFLWIQFVSPPIKALDINLFQWQYFNNVDIGS